MSSMETAVYAPRIVSGSRQGPQGPVLPLSLVHAGEQVKVRRISGLDETRRFLSNLGFVEDARVTVVSEMNGNVIVNVKGTRVAISKSMARRVLTEEAQEEIA